MRKKYLLELIYRKAAKHEDLRIKGRKLCGAHAIVTVKIAFQALLANVRRITSVYMEVSALRGQVSRRIALSAVHAKFRLTT